jgi:cytidylate kinase
MVHRICGREPYSFFLNEASVLVVDFISEQENMKMGYNVAIDGPAGAGKSTIAKLVAEKKGFIYVDTGAMYRGLAIHFLDRGIKAEETEKVIEACRDADVSIRYEDGMQQVYLNGTNITGRLRDEAVGRMTSKCSVIPEVRGKLLDLQRDLAKTRDVIMDGRDIGTCVLPDADVKVYLTASVETRAKRRYDELTAKGESCDFDEIARDIKERDERDMNRETAPLKKAEDAVLVDSSDMTIEEVVHTIAELCR